MNRTDLHFLELTEVAHLIQARKISPVELTQAMLERIEALDRRLHAYALPTPELALVQARKAEDEIGKRRYQGSLHGVPIAFKDLCYTKGIPTAAAIQAAHNGETLARVRSGIVPSRRPRDGASRFRSAPSPRHGSVCPGW